MPPCVSEAARNRRSWRKLHIGMDADTARVVAATLTTSDVDDASQVGPLLDQAGLVASFTADGAYDQDGVYGEVARRSPDGAVIVPSLCRSMPSRSSTTLRRPRRLPMLAANCSRAAMS